jgi:ribonuclease G
MKKIIINKTAWQTRIAITRDNRLQNIYFSGQPGQMTHLERLYFKGKITKVLPGIQTAFVDIGQPKAGFLHISEVDRDLAIERMSKEMQVDEDQPQPKKYIRREKLDISKIFKEGDDVLVQVSKEPVYEKGAKLTTCFTLPGRFLVLMPNIPRIGISKKIEDRQERMRLREIVGSHLPEGMGAIIRTSSQDHTKQEIVKDLNYLVSLWQAILKNFETAAVAEKIHEDLPLSLQIVRDNLDDDVEAVITDDRDSQQEIYKFIKKSAPEYSELVRYYNNPINIFDFYGIQDQIDQALDKKVELKSGGSLIIESAEAMTVVDVNTGKFIGKTNLEDTILKTNLEAAEEVVRQLRLRNIGGLIVIDFIDMATSQNRQKLMRHFEKTLKEQDRFQSVVLKVSEFGLVQMTRKRSGKTLQQQLTEACHCCKGTGHVMSLQNECFMLLSALESELKDVAAHAECTVYVHPDMFAFITKDQYNSILALEKMFQGKIVLESKEALKRGEHHIRLA